MSTSVFYTNQKLLPQSHSPDQLSAWLSSTHPGYSEVAWCFYGNLISNSSTDAVGIITQFIQSPSLPQLEGIGVRPFQSGFMYDSEKTDGYLVSCYTSPFPIPNVTVTSNPFSLVVNYSYDLQGKEQSTTCLSLLDGPSMGSKGANYMLTADVVCFGRQQGTRLRAEIKFVDRMGVVSVGYGPASFAPAIITPQQAKEIKEKYGESIKDYLEKTETPLTDRGSYYYSAPLLEVESFRLLRGDGEVLNQGNKGTLWMDYVVSSWNETSFNLSLGATWTFFAIQFPENGAAIILSALKTESTFQMAKLFRNADCQPIKQNGALAAEHEWSMDEITITPDPCSEWTSPRSNKHYYMKYAINLHSENFQVVLSLQSVRDDQEVFINVPKGKPVAKYEGVFTVSATVNKSEVEWKGHAWGEVKAANSSSPGSDH